MRRRKPRAHDVDALRVHMGVKGAAVVTVPLRRVAWSGLRVDAATAAGASSRARDGADFRHLTVRQRDATAEAAVRHTQLANVSFSQAYLGGLELGHLCDLRGTDFGGARFVRNDELLLAGTHRCSGAATRTTGTPPAPT